ncbi:hypothetical protein LARI1_G007667 [Lachnellula arida]|uniref:Expansin-like EG45 domain-containing protein n=1 Tax=Lachnellula arida TaxID=1316785 RepID=A0A8T9B7N5_9HELO|nr:hypothetical protein LARI1_G007667 [Lachnellula arida]
MLFKPLALTPLIPSVLSASTGVATFNNYAAQSNTVCGPKTGVSGTYGAAIGDLSAIWQGAKCAGSAGDMSKCSGQNPVSGYEGPSCPTTTCGLCFKVCNTGGYGGATVQGVGNCITVDIIDACPSESAWNYCKTEVPADERCGSSGTNSLDVDQSGYVGLTGGSWSSSSPNLAISIESASC